MADFSQMRDLQLAKSLLGHASRELELTNEAIAFAAQFLGRVERSEQRAAQQHHQWRGRDNEIEDGDVPDLKEGDDDHEDDEGDGDGLSDDDCPALAQIVAHLEDLPDSQIEEAIRELEAASPDDLADAAEVISDKCDQLTRLNQLLHAQLDWS